MAHLLDGKQLSAEMTAQLTQEVAELKKQGLTPKLVVVLVGQDPASQIYVRNKERRAKKIGIDSVILRLPTETTEKELLDLVAKLNTDSTVDGILVQLPLPTQISETKVTMAIDPDKDVDGFHPINIGRLWSGKPEAIACTPYGIMKMLEHANIELAGKKAVVIGRSVIVGRPMAALLLNADATVSLAHKRTQNLKDLTQRADILVVAIGVPEFITGDYVKEGAVVVDVGMDRNAEGKLVGDVDFASVEPKASYITPVPGGVGPMTITMLMYQTVEIAKRRKLNG